MDPLIAEIRLFAGNFAPRGWALCDGQLLQISSNSALFSILGTTYGGDGRTTFGLPDYRGRVPLGPRQGPGLPNYTGGQRGGLQTVQLNQTQIPAHSHAQSAGNLTPTLRANAGAMMGNQTAPGPGSGGHANSGFPLPGITLPLPPSRVNRNRDAEQGRPGCAGTGSRPESPIAPRARMHLSARTKTWVALRGAWVSRPRERRWEAQVPLHLAPRTADSPRGAEWHPAPVARDTWAARLLARRGGQLGSHRPLSEA